jgi:hypothetical protein
MKTKAKILYLIAIAALILQSCYIENEGPMGPQGPQGPTGPAGDSGENGYIFEYENVSFTGPDYEIFLDYPEGFEGYDSDVTLVYFLWAVQEDSNGDPLEIWRRLPQTLLIEYGTLIYNFDHTKYDVRLFMDSNFDLNLLSAIDTDDWLVRIVVVPADYWNGRSKVDYDDYYSVKEAYGLPDMNTHESVRVRR